MTQGSTTPGDHELGGRVSGSAFEAGAQHRLGGSGIEEMTPAATDAQAVAPYGSAGTVVAGLFPLAAAALQAELAERLTAMLAARVGHCLDDMIRTRLASFGPAPWGQLEATAEELETLVARVLPSLDQSAAITLLATDPETARLLLEELSPARREAVLDASFRPNVLSRLERACRHHGSRHLIATLDRLPLDHAARSEWRQKLLAADHEPAAPVPQHQDADEASLLSALQRGDRQAAILLLAAASLVPRESIESALALRTRRGLISLAWKAGFSMRAAILLQSELAAIAPENVLTALADGSCPLSRNEMVWQISFLARKLV